MALLSIAKDFVRGSEYRLSQFETFPPSDNINICGWRINKILVCDCYVLL